MDQIERQKNEEKKKELLQQKYNLHEQMQQKEKQR